MKKVITGYLYSYGIFSDPERYGSEKKVVYIGIGDAPVDLEGSPADSSFIGSIEICGFSEMLDDKLKDMRNKKITITVEVEETCTGKCAEFNPHLRCPKYHEEYDGDEEGEDPNDRFDPYDGW